ncbi:hypothetical protein BFAG_00044 [Bacteroides fragilis 3_1_12]|uniref:Uncharacterized protein n=1 Tax=Bacteroides fragilis 3_1_12 TaxID=457424 RepID=A0ABN0BE78_BACFG|nr:hypothetical protein BFAG_00044 [Bacteroides fragilis 3_1_12]
MNNFLLKKILYCLVLLLLTCIITLSLSISDHIKWELTGLYFTIGIITIALFYILQKNNLSGSIINLTTKRNKILLNTLSPISIILSIYVIPVHVFSVICHSYIIINNSLYLNAKNLGNKSKRNTLYNALGFKME